MDVRVPEGVDASVSKADSKSMTTFPSDMVELFVLLYSQSISVFQV